MDSWQRGRLAATDLSEDFTKDAVLFVQLLEATSHALVEGADDERYAGKQAHPHISIDE